MKMKIRCLRLAFGKSPANAKRKHRENLLAPSAGVWENLSGLFIFLGEFHETKNPSGGDYPFRRALPFWRVSAPPPRERRPPPHQNEQPPHVPRHKRRTQVYEVVYVPT